MTHLLDTDHLSVWQWDTMPDSAMMKLHLDGMSDGDVGVTVVTYHEQSNGCHARLNRAKTPQELIDGYELFVRVLKSLQKFPIRAVRRGGRGGTGCTTGDETRHPADGPPHRGDCPRAQPHRRDAEPVRLRQGAEPQHGRLDEVTHPGVEPMSAAQLVRDDAAAVAEVLAAVRPQFPAFVRDAVFQLRADHTGDPAVWIWLILDDDTEIESRDVQAELRQVRWAIFDRILESVPGRWPFVSVRTVSEQRDRAARGAA